MAATPGNQITDLAGTTHTTVVAAPASGQRIITSLRLFNRDSAAVTVILVTDVGGTEREYDKRTGVAVGAAWDPIRRDNQVVLDTSTILQMYMSGAAATTNPVVHATYLDVS